LSSITGAAVCRIILQFTCPVGWYLFINFLVSYVFPEERPSLKSGIFSDFGIGVFLDLVQIVAI
jgi:hypothetical protein